MRRRPGIQGLQRNAQARVGCAPAVPTSSLGAVATGRARNTHPAVCAAGPVQGVGGAGAADQARADEGPADDVQEQLRGVCAQVQARGQPGWRAACAHWLLPLLCATRAPAHSTLCPCVAQLPLPRQAQLYQPGRFHTPAPPRAAAVPNFCYPGVGGPPAGRTFGATPPSARSSM